MTLISKFGGLVHPSPFINILIIIYDPQGIQIIKIDLERRRIAVEILNYIQTLIEKLT